jgi:hypothetical protein
MTLALHRKSAHGLDNIRDSDLARLVEQYPHLSAVIEEVQFLRTEVDMLTDVVSRLPQ